MQSKFHRHQNSQTEINICYKPRNDSQKYSPQLRNGKNNPYPVVSVKAQQRKCFKIFGECCFVKF